MKEFIEIMFLVLLINLTGCQHRASADKTEPAYIVQTQTVTKQVSVSCVKEEQIPAKPDWSVDHVNKKDSIAVKANALKTEHLQREDYVPKLEAIVAACLKAGKQ